MEIFCKLAEVLQLHLHNFGIGCLPRTFHYLPKSRFLFPESMRSNSASFHKISIWTSKHSLFQFSINFFFIYHADMKMVVVICPKLLQKCLSSPILCAILMACTRGSCKMFFCAIFKSFATWSGPFYIMRRFFSAHIYHWYLLVINKL